MAENPRSAFTHWIGTCAAITLGVIIGLAILGAVLLLWLVRTW